MLAFHPFTLSRKDLFYNVTNTTITAAKRTDISTDITYFLGSISRTTGQATTLQNLIIRDVIPHVKNLFILKSVFGKELLISIYLTRTTYINVLDAQSFISLFD